MAHNHEHHHHEHCSCEHHHHEHCSCDHHHQAHHHHEEQSLGRQLLLVGASALLLAAAVAVEKTCGLPTWQLLLLFLTPYLLIGHSTLREAAEGLLHGDAFNEHFLMSVATIGALAIGFLPGAEPQFAEAVFVMLFFQVGELFEGYAEGQSRKSIAHLMEIRPDVAHIATDGPSAPQDVSPETVAVGQTIVVLPGERVPLDGVIASGSSAFDTSALTGESEPRTASEGDEVFSGSINLQKTVLLRTTKVFGESTVSKIIHLVEEASEQKSDSETFIARFARVYTPVVVFAAVAIVVVPLALSAFMPFSYHFATWLYRALMFLVVSCPCALVISVPLTFYGGIGGASRHGILIKGSKFIDVLAALKVFVFDKTGTLTHGTVLRQADGSMSRQVVGDQLRAEARQALQQLRRLGIEKTVMLTGDRDEVARRVAEAVGIDDYRAELLPTDKVAALDAIIAQSAAAPSATTQRRPSATMHHRPHAHALTAFVGDGINDAPVLARADVGIAMGALGSDAAIDAADVVLMDDSLTRLPLAVAIARRTIAIARQNVVFAIGVKVAVLLLAAFGLATMWMAVFADVGVTVLAVLNAMRALAVTPPVAKA